MAATSVPALDFSAQIVEPGAGKLTTYGDAFLRALWNRTGGETDKVDAAHALAGAAVPQGTEVVAVGGLQAGGRLGGNIGVALYVSVDAAANLPTTGVQEGDWAYATDGCKTGESSGSGTGVPVWWSNSGWYAVDSGAVVMN